MYGWVGRLSETVVEKHRWYYLSLLQMVKVKYLEYGDQKSG